MKNNTFNEHLLKLREKLHALTFINHEKYLFCFHDHYKTTTYSAWVAGKPPSTSGMFGIRDNIVFIRENGLLSNLERKEIQEILRAKIHNFNQRV